MISGLAAGIGHGGGIGEERGGDSGAGEVVIWVEGLIRLPDLRIRRGSEERALRGGEFRTPRTSDPMSGWRDFEHWSRNAATRQP
jgi:hypothetical protein